MQRYLRQALSALSDAAASTSRAAEPLLAQTNGWRTPAGAFAQARGAKSYRMVEVILLQDVEGLGVAGHIVKVKPGR